MKKSDWKQFTEVKQNALDRFCKLTLDGSQNIINDESKTAHERYLQLFKYMDEQDETLARTFNGHSRNNAWLQLLSMRSLNLVKEEELAEFSEEFLASTAPPK